MAQKRLLDKKIAISEKVADLPILGQLIYERAITFADDFGLLQASSKTIKAQTIPMVDCLLSEIEENINKILASGLWTEIVINGDHFWKISKFSENQNLRRDMQPSTIISGLKFTKNYSENWEMVETLIDQNNTTSDNFGRNRTTSDEIVTEDTIQYNTVHNNTVHNKTINTNVLIQQADEKKVEEIVVLEEKKEYGNPDVNEGMAILKEEFNGSLTQIKLNRYTLSRLIKSKGKDPVLKRMRFALKVRENKFAPMVCSYMDLEKKWEQLETYARRETKAQNPKVADFTKQQHDWTD